MVMADMLPFPALEAGRPGEIGEKSYDMRLVVFMQIPVSTEELSFRIIDYGTRMDHRIPQ